MAFDVLGIIAPHPPIMVPEVGHRDAEATRASAEALGTAAALLSEFQPETVVVMSPHATAYRDAFTVTTAERLYGDLSQFGAGSVRREVPGDPELASAIQSACESHGIPVGSRPGRLGPADLDHGVLVPMHFLDPDGRYPLVVLSLSYLPYETHRALGEAVARAACAIGRRVAFVASGDCSHRLKQGAPAGFEPRAHLFDEQLQISLSSGDFTGLMDMDESLVEEAGECGLRSFIALGGFLDGTDASPRVLAYEAPWGVGYLSAVYAPAAVLEERLGPERGGLQAASSPATVMRTPESGRKGGHAGSDESEPVRIARRTIECHVRGEDLPKPAQLPAEGFPARAGAFVSLHRNGELRGCIGTISPTCDLLSDEIVRNAVEASTRDPRFPPLTAQELEDLDIKVDVLHEAEPICSLEELDPRVYGVIVTSGWKRGLLLPDLEGVDTPEQQVSIAMAKAGIGPGETVQLERFRVDRHV